MNLEERFEWLKQHPFPGWKPTLETPTWEEIVQTIRDDMYSFAFNHPYYVGYGGLSDDEMRHRLLDDFDVPR